MKKMRLLALTTSYPLRPGSSSGVFVQSLYRRLSAECAIDVVCPADSKPTKAAFEDGAATGIRIHAVRYAPRAWRRLAQESGGVVAGLRRAPWYVLLLPGLLFGLFGRCLLRADDVVMVMAMDALSVSRVARMKVGDRIRVQDGIVQGRGRRR